MNISNNVAVVSKQGSDVYQRLALVKTPLMGVSAS